jgi:PilZ domain
MVPVLPQADDPDPESAADPWADRRAGDRRPVRPGTRFEVRRGGDGPDLAVALLDVSATGLRAAVRGGFSVGDAVVVWIAPPGEGWVYQGTAFVCWQSARAEGTALVGLRLRSPIPVVAAVDLAEPDTR